MLKLAHVLIDGLKECFLTESQFVTDMSQNCGCVVANVLNRDVYLRFVDLLLTVTDHDAEEVVRELGKRSLAAVVSEESELAEDLLFEHWVRGGLNI